jgi:putative flippase GtrA
VNLAIRALPSRREQPHRSVAGSDASPRHAAGDRAATGRHGSSAPRSLARDLGSFAMIGLVSTAAYAILFSLFRGFVPAITANALALCITAFGNTAANRRLTFGIQGRQSLIRDHGAGLVAFLIALSITTGSIGALHAVAPAAGRAVELAILTIANVLATAIRFVLLRAWIAGRRAALLLPSRP